MSADMSDQEERKTELLDLPGELLSQIAGYVIVMERTS